ncbi:MAG: GTPase HflX [Candidatus Omnitrophica bacterium]|nr:GTPase HflX [Candidatus Omnitrophota bacterium]
MERAITVTVDLGKREDWTAEERSHELRELASSCGASVIKELIVNRDRIDSGHYIGSGKVEEIAIICAEEKIDAVIFNNDLTGSQEKNLEKIIKAKIVDRTRLILDIFARRAHSNEGKLQVELARLLYMLPRLTGKGVEMSRPGGGIGTSGPGEQKLEVDRRRINSRMSRLKKELDGLSKRRGMMRKKRTRNSLPSIAIVGYTNAGKSTLINALTSSNVIVQDKLFSTLDPTVRRFVLPGRREILFIDTVGFIDRLPHHLVEAFKATLEEVSQADMLLHVVDISHPKAKEQSDAVYKVLDEIGAKGKPVITALNKIDKVQDRSLIDKALKSFVNPVPISALKREGLDGLIASLINVKTNP